RQRQPAGEPQPQQERRSQPERRPAENEGQQPEQEHDALARDAEHDCRQPGQQPGGALHQEEHEDRLEASAATHLLSIERITLGSRSMAKGPPGLGTIQTWSMGGAVMLTEPSGQVASGDSSAKTPPPKGLKQMCSCSCQAVSEPPGEGPKSPGRLVSNMAPTRTRPARPRT